MRHGPASHEPRVEIKDHRQIEPALGGPDVSEVPGPDSGRLCHRKLALERVLGHGQPVIRQGSSPPLLHNLGPNVALTHQPGHAMRADVVPLLDQSLPDAGTAVGFP